MQLIFSQPSSPFTLAMTTALLCTKHMFDLLPQPGSLEATGQASTFLFFFFLFFFCCVC